MTDQDQQDQQDQQDITEALEQGNQQAADDFEMQYEDYLKLLEE